MGTAEAGKPGRYQRRTWYLVIGTMPVEPGSAQRRSLKRPDNLVDEAVPTTWYHRAASVVPPPSWSCGTTRPQGKVTPPEGDASSKPYVPPSRKKIGRASQP